MSVTRHITAILFVGLVLTACTKSQQRRQEMDRRWQALKEKQERELLQAQQELTTTDSLLQIAEAELQRQEEEVAAHKMQLKATSDELTRLTRARIYCDSLRVQANVQGAKIRYIRQKKREIDDRH